MREIKFRGKKCRDGQWVYGHYVESHKTWRGLKPHKSWIITSALSNGGFFNIMGRYAVKDDTVGQFTGLTDKNGREIYEGDIVKHVAGLKKTKDGTWVDDAEIMLVHFNGAAFNINYYSKVTSYIEIIGNRYDNPELVKGLEI